VPGAEASDRVGGSERARIVAAVIELAAERGYDETTIDLALARAGLDRTAFDRHFRGRYDCFLQIWREVNGDRLAATIRACESDENRPERLRAVAEEIARGLRGDPSRA